MDGDVTVRKRLIKWAARYPAGGDWAGRARSLTLAAELLPVNRPGELSEVLDLLIPALEGLRDCGRPEAVRSHLKIWRRLDARLAAQAGEKDPVTALFIQYRLADACEAAAALLKEDTQREERETLRREADSRFSQVADSLENYLGADSSIVSEVRERAQNGRRENMEQI